MQGNPTTLVTNSAAQQRFVDVIDAALLARNERVVIDRGELSEEYVQLKLVQRGEGAGGSDRIWFGAFTRFGHAATATVEEVVLSAKTSPDDYDLSAVDGVVTTVIGNVRMISKGRTTALTIPSQNAAASSVRSLVNVMVASCRCV